MESGGHAWSVTLKPPILSNSKERRVSDRLQDRNWLKFCGALALAKLKITARLRSSESEICMQHDQLRKRSSLCQREIQKLKQRKNGMLTRMSMMRLPGDGNRD